jgi:hypothetical protein
MTGLAISPLRLIARLALALASAIALGAVLVG